MRHRTLCLVTLLIALTGACRVLDVQTDPHATGIRSDALIEGYATVGFADDPSLLRVDLLDGPSRGGIFYFELWYLLRLELGLAGFAVGVGPFDFGIGTLFYHPRSPSAAPIDDEGEWHWHRPGVHVHVGGRHDDDCEVEACQEPTCFEAVEEPALEVEAPQAIDAETPAEARAEYVEQLDAALEEQRAEGAGTP